MALYRYYCCGTMLYGGQDFTVGVVPSSLHCALPTSELNILEADMLHFLDFQLFVSHQEFEQQLAALQFAKYALD
jgi:hypothetical protein